MLRAPEDREALSVSINASLSLTSLAYIVYTTGFHESGIRIGARASFHDYQINLKWLEANVYPFLSLLY
jgi:hypothetical protein